MIFVFDNIQQHFSNLLEVRTTYLIQNSSADRLTLVPFKSKFINFVAFFNTSILVCNFACSIIIGVLCTVWGRRVIGISGSLI